jgi:hypothetical protein
MSKFMPDPSQVAHRDGDTFVTHSLPLSWIVGFVWTTLLGIIVLAAGGAAAWARLDSRVSTNETAVHQLQEKNATADTRWATITADIAAMKQQLADIHDAVSPHGR